MKTLTNRTIVSIDDNYKWETEEEALAYGLKCKAYYLELATEAGLL